MDEQRRMTAISMAATIIADVAREPNGWASIPMWVGIAEEATGVSTHRERMDFGRDLFEEMKKREPALASSPNPFVSPIS